VGAEARVPVGLLDVFSRSCWRAPRGVAVGAGARLPVGLFDMPHGCFEWAPEVLQWAREHGCP